MDEPTESFQTSKNTFVGTMDGLRPGHDIFCTPENNSFYETNSYTDLNPLEHEIRLVKLYSGHEVDGIRCELLPPTHLSQVKGTYTAPSYCAGDVRDTKLILLNGTSFTVFANLEHALRQVRDFWNARYYNNEECILWIDQISINQSNVKEMTHQVRFMREIYENAQQVLVCLSTREVDSRGADWAFESVKEVPPDWTFKDKIHIAYDFQDRAGKHMKARLSDEAFLKAWLAFYEMVESPWFSRAWVFQELIVASDVFFIYAGKAMHIEDVLSTWPLICDWRCGELMGVLQLGMEKGGAYNQTDNEDNRDELSSLIKRLDRDGRETIASNMVFMLDTRVSWRDDPQQGPDTVDLKRLLTHSRYCNTTDPRDHIFAFLGLANHKYDILPDYACSIAEVLIETTSKIIQLEGSLNVLYYATISQHQLNSDLPSWVVDWTSPEMSAYKDTPTSNIRAIYDITGLDNIEGNASFTTLGASNHSMRALYVQGVLIETIQIEPAVKRGSAKPRSAFQRVDSSNGFTFLCHGGVRQNDGLWFIQGSGAPLILRSSPCGNHTLIAVAHVVLGVSFSRSFPTFPTRKHFNLLLERMKDVQGGWRAISMI